MAVFVMPIRPTSGRLVEFLLLDPGFQRACDRLDNLHGPIRADPLAVMWPAPGSPSTWPVPSLTTPSELANYLQISREELEWLADRQGRERRIAAEAPHRYRYRWVAKRSGSARLVEIPCSRLQTIQKRVLRGIIAAIPPHAAAHGFRTGCSIKTYVESHVGHFIVLKLDLADFFPTITAARITALFLTAGYPEPVARLLAGLSTNSAPSLVWKESAAPPQTAETWRARKLYREPHLPQGASTSPALANLCAYRLDCRLSGLAKSAGASYTRYADDLAFSGDARFSRQVQRFHIHACAVALEEGFVVQTRKTRIMRQGNRQCIAGVVVNDRPNIRRDQFDTLKAILHNCVKHGFESQNRLGHHDFRSHLLGRIAHVGSIHPERGAKLRLMFDQIPGEPAVC
jgi:RNA-directed DNA polymerase